VREKYSEKLSKQEALIKDSLLKQGYVFFEHGGVGVAMSQVFFNELAARDGITSEMKDTVMETEHKMEAETELLQSEKKEFEDARKTVEKEQKELNKFKQTEKKKRFKMYESIKNLFVKDGAVVLESGDVLAAPQQCKVELEVRSAQLRSTLESVDKMKGEVKSLKEEFEKKLTEKEKEVQKRDNQLQRFRRT
jgi:hypothetical protein